LLFLFKLFSYGDLLTLCTWFACTMYFFHASLCMDEQAVTDDQEDLGRSGLTILWKTVSKWTYLYSVHEAERLAYTTDTNGGLWCTTWAVSLTGITLQLATCSQSQCTIQSMNIHSTPVVVRDTAPPTATEQNDRLTNA